jgi:hypothetical protein
MAIVRSKCALVLGLLLCACGDSGSGGAGGGSGGESLGGSGGENLGGSGGAATGPADCTPPCTDYIAMQGPDCEITQMECEEACMSTIAGLPAECSDEYLQFLACTATAPVTSYTCNPNGPMYVGDECDAAGAPLNTCLGA